MRNFYILFIISAFLLLIDGSAGFIGAAEKEGSSKEFGPFSPKLPVTKEETTLPQEQKEEIPEPTFLEEIDIQGLIWGTPTPQAIIDGWVYKVGDIIKDTDAEIIEIKKGEIKVRFLGRVYTVKMKKELNKEGIK
ncbi:MAG: hypothetical protein J7K17_04430 [Candidatus Omnitrophica bacterium]|nr:hypothetical protein [Candidatus Omnitrophota bacterium]